MHAKQEKNSKSNIVRIKFNKNELIINSYCKKNGILILASTSSKTVRLVVIKKDSFGFTATSGQSHNRWSDRSQRAIS